MQNRSMPYGTLALFLVLSTADLFMTVLLLMGGEGKVIEANPIARAWLLKYHLTGLIMFKVAIMALVSGVGLIISLYRPETGKRLLTFACMVVGVVVLYSYNILKKVL